MTEKELTPHLFEEQGYLSAGFQDKQIIGQITTLDSNSEGELPWKFRIIGISCRAEYIKQERRGCEILGQRFTFLDKDIRYFYRVEPAD